MKPVIVEYVVKKNDGSTTSVKRPIEFPDTCPIHLFAAAQPSIHIAWIEKMALKKRIEELESQLLEK